MRINGTEFVVPETPEEWRGWGFSQKRAWLIARVSPRPTFNEAQAILAQHAKMARDARAHRMMMRQRRRELRGGELNRR
jgi:hypothetical protein